MPRSIALIRRETKLNKAIQLSEQNGFRHLYAECLIKRTNWNPQHPTAHADLQRVISLMKQDGNLLQLGMAWFNMGQFLRRRRAKGDFTAARQSMYTAQKIAKSINDRSLDASTSMSIANLEVMFGNSREAEKNFQRSYELNRRLGRIERTSSLGKYGFVVYPHWQYRERLANAQACQKDFGCIQG